MTSKRYYGQIPIDIYNKPMKDLVVDFINHQNGRDLKVEDLEIETTGVKDEMGRISLSIRPSQSSGLHDNGLRFLKSKRADIQHVIPDGQFTIHCNELDNESLVNAIFEQYNVLLELDHIEITNDNPVVVAPFNIEPEVSQTDPEDDTGDVPGDDVSVPGDVPGELPPDEPGDTGDGESGRQDGWFTLTFKDTHLLFEGSIKIRVVESIEFLGKTISSLLEIRNYFVNPEAELNVPVELHLGKTKMVANGYRAERLHRFIPNERNDMMSLAEILNYLTGDDWVCSNDPCPFNIKGCEIIYNGLSSNTHISTDPRYDYVFVLNLSPVFCDNLRGIIKISYQRDVYRPMDRDPHIPQSFRPRD